MVVASSFTTGPAWWQFVPHVHPPAPSFVPLGYPAQLGAMPYSAMAPKPGPGPHTAAPFAAPRAAIHVAPSVPRVPSAIEIFNAVKQRIAADDEGTTEEEELIADEE
jgi:hypothetical protein